MVFGMKKMQNDLFCVTEERNYFQSKYLEQVNEIAALKEELRKSKREISKLRGELMESSMSELPCDDASIYSTPVKNRRRSRHSVESGGGDSAFQEEKKDNEASHSNTSDTGKDEHDDDDEEEEEEEEDKEAADIRQSAEKLLQWASYRTYARSSSASSPDHGSVASPTHLAEDSLLGPMVPRTIESTSLDDRSQDNLSQTLSHDSLGGVMANGSSHDDDEAAAADGYKHNNNDNEKGQDEKDKEES